MWHFQSVWTNENKPGCVEPVQAIARRMSLGIMTGAIHKCHSVTPGLFDLRRGSSCYHLLSKPVHSNACKQVLRHQSLAKDRTGWRSIVRLGSSVVRGSSGREMHQTHLIRVHVFVLFPYDHRLSLLIEKESILNGALLLLRSSVLLVVCQELNDASLLAFCNAETAPHGFSKRCYCGPVIDLLAEHDEGTASLDCITIVCVSAACTPLVCFGGSRTLLRYDGRTVKSWHGEESISQIGGDGTKKQSCEVVSLC